MLTLPHIIVGAAIGSQIPNPYAVGAMSFGSHFVLDSIPHWQEPLAPYIPTKATYIRIAIEIIVSLGLLYYLTNAYPEKAFTMWVGAIFSPLPDTDSFIVYRPKLLKNKLLSEWWNFHCRIQRETASLLGLIPQMVVIIISLVIIFNQ